MTASPPSVAVPLLGPDDPPPFVRHNAAAAGSLVLLCDHASNRVPAALHGLGLPATDLGSHFGWDIGAATVARTVADRMAAPAVFCGYSRLVIDCNRPIDAPDSIVAQIDGRPVPGNRDLDAGARAGRIDGIFRPYHAAIAGLLDDRAGRGLAHRLVCMHSFTPVFGGLARPWHVGISYGRCDGFARALLAVLRRDPSLVVGEHEPYPVEAASDVAVPVHGDGRDSDAVLIEIRQDLLADDDAALHWGLRMAEALALAQSEADPVR